MDEKLVEYRLNEQAKELDELKGRVAQMEKDEKSRLRWGIGALGSVIMALAGVIWAYRGVIFK